MIRGWVSRKEIEECALSYFHICYVWVIRRYGSYAGSSINVVGTGRSDVIVHQFRHHTARIDTNTLATYLVAHILRADKQVVNRIHHSIGHTGSISSCLIVGQDTDTFILVREGTGTLQTVELAALMIVIGIHASQAELAASVPQHGETVQIDTITLPALKGLQQTGNAHRLVIIHDGNRRRRGRGVTVTQFIVVNHQLLPANALWQEMVRDELVQHIHLVRIVIVEESAGHIIEQARLAQEVANVGHLNLISTLPQLLFPETVCLRKKRKAIITMLRNGSHLTDRGMLRQILHLASQVQVFPRLITIGIKRVFQPTSQYQTRHHTVSALGIL